MMLEPITVVSRHYHDARWENPSLWSLFHHIEAEGVPVDQFKLLRMLLRRYHIVHIHWPEKHMARRSWWSAWLYTLVELVLLDVQRLKGARVVWTAHNVASHEGWYPRLERWCWWAMLRRVDAFISFSESGRRIVHDTHPRTRWLPSFVVRDGHYRDIYPNHGDAALARRRLGLDARARVLLFFGSVRPYKNVPGLIDAFRRLPDRDLQLVIAGKAFTPTLAEEIRSAAAGDERICIDDRFVPDEAIQDYMNAADLAVLPFENILNSGSAQLVLSFHRPVLVSERGAMAELASLAGSDWVRLFQPPLEAGHLEAALAWALEPARPARLDFAWGEWPTLARETIAAYRQIRI